MEGMIPVVEKVSQVYRHVAEDAEESWRAIVHLRAEQERIAIQVAESLRHGTVTSEGGANGGVLRMGDLANIEQGVLRTGDLDQYDRGVLGRTGKSGGGGGGGGSRGPSGKDGDPVSCRTPGTEDAVNNQTDVLGGWLSAIFQASKDKSYGGQYIGKPLWMRPGGG